MSYLNLAGYLAIPLAFLLHWFAHGKGWEPAATFVMAGVGVVPLARLMGGATEHLSERTGPTWGGLLNATFGNAAELIIAIIALSKGLNGIVQASLTGSILGNLLLVAGGAMVYGGWNRENQTFSRAAAETNSGLLALAVASMLFPAIFHYTGQHASAAANLLAREHRVSLWSSGILLAVYGLGLLFTLRTHAHVFNCAAPAPAGAPAPESSEEDESPARGEAPAWSVRRSVLMLLLASAGVAIVAELLVGSAETMATNLGWSQVFVGIILLAIIGNAAEHSTALALARRNDMNTAMTITYQSSLQIALFVTPLLVLVSAVFVATGVQRGPALDLIFSPMEVAAVILTVGTVIVVGLNGETNWFEGVMLLALYAILAVAFFYIPAGEPAR